MSNHVLRSVRQSRVGQVPDLPSATGARPGRSGTCLTLLFLSLASAVAQTPNFQNSSKVHDLIRAGNLYLSLPDALALAIENNLDIELSRYNL